MPSTLGIVASGLWTPLELAPVLWLDASDTATISESGGLVSQWNDKSGNGNDLTQGNAAFQPETGVATIAGKNVLRYDGDDRMFSPFISFTGLTMLSVFQHISDRYVLLATDDSGDYAGVGDPGSGSSNITNDLGTMNLRFNGSPFTGTTRRDVYNEFSFSTKVVTLDVSASFTKRLNPFSYVNSGFSPVCAIAEVIIVDGSLTASEIATTEAYLANKWGISF